MKHYIYRGIYIVYALQESLEDYGITYKQLNYKIFRLVNKNRRFLKQDANLHNFVNLNKKYVLAIKSTLTAKCRIEVLGDMILEDIKSEDITLEILN